MRLIEVTTQSEWETFIEAQQRAQFTQSWAWGEFQRSQNHAVRRFCLLDEQSSVLLAAQMIRYDRRFSGYWFCPRGPIFSAAAKTDPRSVFRFFLNELDKQGLDTRSLFLRFEPFLDLNEAQGFLSPRLRRTHAMNPASTRLIDLTKDEEILLREMHEKTRYNIRVASKHGVTVREGTNDDLEIFLRLTHETAQRDKIAPHADDYLRATYDFLAPLGLAKLRIAECQSKPLVANLEIWFGDTVTYLHGASSSEARHVMAPYAMQWEAMREAKRKGFRWYDLGGCNPISKASMYYKTSWEGISRFKQGWGGEAIDLLGTWDLPLQRFIYALVFHKGLWRG